MSMATPLIYEPLPLGPMQECGSSLLKALQNDSMVPLDLLVRESIQNSLDASNSSKPVVVSFDFRSHTTDTVASLLGAPLAESMRARMGSKAQRMLVVRDTNTCGLTGKVRLKDYRDPNEPHGNFIKLVYEVGRSQESRKKGGSWGLGKTVYFRVGCGLVFYYSRIRDGDRYSERLAACLVENEKSPRRLQRDTATGIAWWGGGDGPLLDDASIRKVLGVLDVTPFGESETGTCVIVPFLRDDLGPPAQNGDDSEGDRPDAAPLPYWHTSYEAYIKVATQRWYGIRLNNRSYREGRPLEVSVGGERISQQLPLFQLAQHLYNSCDGTRSQRVIPGPNGTQINVHVDEIGNMRVAVEGATTVGRVASALVTPEQLGMANPTNAPSPHLCVSGRDNAGASHPLVAFLRGHGMVIRWDDRGDSRGWAKGCGTTTGSFLVAVVVPIGSLALHKKALLSLKHEDPEPLLLEEYLRSCEKADHHQWSDPVRVTIVARMKERVAEKLKARVPQTGPTVATVTPFLAARTIADKLMPEGFGTDGRRGPGATPQGEPREPSSRSSKTPDFEVRGVRHREGGLSVDWELTWRTRRLAPASIDLLVDTEGRPLGADDWRRFELGQFPLQLRKSSAKPAARAGASTGDVSVKTTVFAEGVGILISPSGELPKGVKTLSVEGTAEIDFAGRSVSLISPVLKVSTSRTSK